MEEERIGERIFWEEKNYRAQDRIAKLEEENDKLKNEATESGELEEERKAARKISEEERGRKGWKGAKSQEPKRSSPKWRKSYSSGRKVIEGLQTDKRRGRQLLLELRATSSASAANPRCAPNTSQPSPFRRNRLCGTKSTRCCPPSGSLNQPSSESKSSSPIKSPFLLPKNLHKPPSHHLGTQSAMRPTHQNRSAPASQSGSRTPFVRRPTSTRQEMPSRLLARSAASRLRVRTHPKGT